MQRSIAGMVLALAIVLGALAAARASAQTLTTLHSFGVSDGANPEAGLIADASGNLYGTTAGGGAHSAGTVFKLTPSGSETVLYTFIGSTDGGAPEAGLIADASGNLYGTTVYGGGCGNGTVFKLTPSGSETVLHGFCLSTDGLLPYAGLIADASGNLYGTTSQGGGSANCVGGVGGCGTVFVVPPSGSETVLHSFTDSGDAAYPDAGLIADASGNLYGTTNSGGAYGAGTVFKLTPSGSETVLYSFINTSGALPGKAGLIADASGNLYGTTNSGGAYSYGTVFKLTPSGSETVLYSFTGGSDGRGPEAGLIFDASGNLYGTTFSGGAHGYGTVFKLTPSGSETVLHSFTGSDGAYPAAGLIADAAGNLYGTTVEGGVSDLGTVFKLSGAGTPLSENPQTSDFNAAGKSDILWQNTNGQPAIWLMNGTTPTTEALVGANPGTSWRIVGAGDFFGSLYSDILWQNLNGAVAIWQINQTAVAASAVIGNPGTSWHVIGSGDFNGDGYSDILWQNTNGQVVIWEMNGTKVIGGGVVGNPGTAWHVIGSGDFNGDGYSDILFQNSNGQVVIWEMNGTKVTGGGVVGNPGTSWHVIGSGDFNGDGYSDILFQNTSGAVAIWEMNGLKVIASAVIGNPGTSWHVIGSGDFNGDGYSDILFQNTNGQVVIWEMNGTKVIGGGVVGNPGIGWRAIGQ
jgi:uncharacterized repeat protein (TIGR03803 family)